MTIDSFAGTVLKGTSLAIATAALAVGSMTSSATSSFPEGTFVGLYNSRVNSGGSPCPNLSNESAFGAAATVITDKNGNGQFAEAVIADTGDLAFTTSCTVQAGALTDCTTTVFDGNNNSNEIASAGTILMASLNPQKDAYVLTPGDVINVVGSCSMEDADYSRPSGVTLARELDLSNLAPEITTAEQVSETSRTTTRSTVTATTAQARAALVSFRKAGDKAQTTSGIAPVAGGLRYSGQAAGDGFEYPFGVWATYQYSEFEDNFVATAFDADRNALLVGADFSPWENTVFGVAFSYEDSDIDSTFNAGNTDIDGYTIAPYMGFYISDYVNANFDMSVDFTVGYSDLDIDTERTAGGVKVTGDTSSTRFFFGGNINAGQQFGNLYVNGVAGMIFARDDIDGFTENNGNVVPDVRTEFGQLRIGGEVAYSINAFEPFVGAVYEYDYEQTRLPGGHPNDPNGIRAGGGLRYYGNVWSGSVEYNTIFDRKKFDDDALTITIRGDF